MFKETTEENFNLLRWVTNNTGKIFESQIVALKRSALFLGESEVTISIFPEDKKVCYVFTGKERTVFTQLKKLTNYVLGDWQIDVQFLSKGIKNGRKSKKVNRRKNSSSD